MGSVLEDSAIFLAKEESIRLMNSVSGRRVTYQSHLRHDWAVWIKHLVLQGLFLGHDEVLSRSLRDQGASKLGNGLGSVVV